MVTEAVRNPRCVGVNVTLSVQLAPAAKVAAQVLVSAKSPASVPVTAMLTMFTGCAPILVTVTVCGALVPPG